METSANGIYYADETMGHPDLTNAVGSLTTLFDEILPLANFSKIYTGTSKAVYQSNDPESSQLFFRLDDTVGANARCRGYETMSDVDTGTGLFPLDSQISGGFYVYKSAAGTARPWRFYSNGKIFYLFIDPNSNGTWSGGTLFGDGNSFVANDFYGTLIGGSASTNAAWAFSTLNNTTGICIARALNQDGGSIYATRQSHAKTTFFGYTSNSQFFPRKADNRLSLYHVDYWDSTTDERGRWPGLWNPIHNGDIPEGYEFSNIPALPSRVLKTQSTGTATRQCLMDKTGPW